MNVIATPPATIPGIHAEALLQEISTWGNVMTIVMHLGSVFEFKGPFPTGEQGHGYYNFSNDTTGFQGHLNLTAVDHIAFQEKPHRGRESYALVFNTEDKETLFKVFLGRDDAGELLVHQKRAFFQIKNDFPGALLNEK